MASASLSFNLAPISSLPLPPPHALIEPAPPSLIPQRPWRTPTIPRPQAIHAPSVPSCSSYSSSSSRRRAFSTPRAFPNNSSAIDEDPEPDQFLRINSISDFIRFKRGEAAGSGDIVGELQTAVVSYRKRFPWSLLHPLLQVDLVSAIHIADKEYFETLQGGLDSYDCVLYEMVASKESLENKSKGKLIPKKSKSFIGFIQRQMAGILSLNFQLDCLDYESEKWQHADLDFETFQLLQLWRFPELLVQTLGVLQNKCYGLIRQAYVLTNSGTLETDERGENFFTLAKEMMLKSPETLIQPSIPSDLGPWKSKLLWASRVLPMPLVGLLIISSVCLPFENDSTEYSELEALSRLDAAAALKIFLAKRLTSDFAQITAVIEENSVIIGERNRVAAEALRRAVDSGHQRIAILYGGGHMPDLGRRLREEFDMVPSRAKWITAWSIRNKQPNINSSPFLKALAKLLGWPLDRYQTLALLFFSATLALDLWLWELFFHTVITLASSVASKVNLLTGIM